MSKTKIKDMAVEVDESKDKIEDGALKEELSSTEDSTVETQPATVEEEAKPKKKQKPGKRKKVRSKKYQATRELVDKTKSFPIEEAVLLAQKSSYSKYDGTFEIHLNSKLKNLRGFVSLPYASGKQIKVLVFGSDEDLGLKPGEEKDGVTLGTDETIAEIQKGKISFDILITSPQWMPKITPLARFLGPRGLMPNPKNNTITDRLAAAVKDIQSGKMEYKSEANGKVIHLAIGKVSQPKEELVANVKALMMTVGKTKVSKITLSPSLGMGVKVDLASI